MSATKEFLLPDQYSIAPFITWTPEMVDVYMEYLGDDAERWQRVSPVLECNHSFPDTGMRYSYCNHCGQKAVSNLGRWEVI